MVVVIIIIVVIIAILYRKSKNDGKNNHANGSSNNLDENRHANANDSSTGYARHGQIDQRGHETSARCGSVSETMALPRDEANNLSFMACHAMQTFSMLMGGTRYMAHGVAECPP